MFAAIEHEPIAGAEVCALSLSEPMNSPTCALANGNGEYTLPTMQTGSYAVEFTGKVCPARGECQPVYAKQFYGGKAALAEATPVAVNVATTTTGIDAALFELSPTKPASTEAPLLSGNAAVGGLLTCAPGRWANKPTALEYAWLRDGLPIPGQLAGTYRVQSADAGHSISCAVTASNGAGSATATSAALNVPRFAPGTETVGRALVRHGIAAVELRCGAGTCVGTLEVVAAVKQELAGKRHSRRGSRRVRKRHVVIGSARFSMASGTTETVDVPLSARGRTLLRQAGKRGLKVEVDGQRGAGRAARSQGGAQPHLERRHPPA